MISWGQVPDKSDQVMVGVGWVGSSQGLECQVEGLDFLFFWLRWVFVAACRLSLVVASRDYSLLRCAGFSLRWLLLFRSTGSRHTGFSSCGARASLLRVMRDLPRPGIEPVSPALAGGFLTAVPPGKSSRGGIFLQRTVLCAKADEWVTAWRTGTSQPGGRRGAPQKKRPWRGRGDGIDMKQGFLTSSCHEYLSG